MIKHPIRKFLGLFVLSSVIILGIFLIQFRSETAISRTFGGLRIQLVETQGDNQQKFLKNSFQSTFRGLNLFANDQEPVTVTKVDGTEVPVSLYKWQGSNPSDFTLFFEQDVSLFFSVRTEGTSEYLSIEANLPEDAVNISIPYKPASGYLVTDQNARRAILSSKSLQYEAMAAQVTPAHLIMSDKEQVATYSVFDPLHTFEYSMAETMPLSAETTYAETIAKFKSDFIQLAAQSISDTSTEQLVVAYVAAMAENRQYREAINKIPSSIRNGNRRTYLSAPYFNTLVSMNASLVRHIENRTSMISYAVQQQSLDIFTIQDLAELLCVLEGNGNVERLLKMPSTLAEFEPTTAQAAGILNTYTRLMPLDRTLAELLHPVVDRCLETIAAACMIEDGVIRLTENEAPLPLLDAISTGMSLVSFGQLSSGLEYKMTGHLIVNSYITAEVSANIRVMTELYPIMVPANPYYPHITIVANAAASGNNKPIWAWTATRSISFARNSSGNVTLTFDFPPNETHHAIVNNIRPFRSIEIYDVTFRTDPRFESYNSSGYVYNAETQTMFLKSLHRTQRENIRLYYGEEAEQTRPAATPTTTPTPAPPAPAPQETEAPPAAETEAPQEIQSLSRFL